MDKTELDTLLHKLYRTSDDIGRAILVFQELIDYIRRINLAEDIKGTSICTYENAIRVLNDALYNNQELCRAIKKLIEVFECCSDSPKGLFGRESQVSQRLDDAVALRRKALAEALRENQPVMVSDHNIQVNMVSSEDDNNIGNAFEGIVVPSGKLAGGMPSRCRVCNNIVFSGACYCPYCGSAVSIEKPSVKLQKVQFSAIAPTSLSRGEYSIINIIMYEESARHIVDELVNSMGEPSQEAKSGVQKVSEGASIKVILNSPDFSIEDNVETGVWQGEYLDFSFALQIPDNYRKRKILLTAIVYINDIIDTKLKFVVKCSSHSEQRITVSRSDIFSAFISYASQDRNRVAAIIQGMKKARPDLDVFFDVDSLRSGDDWELALHEEIRRRDVLFLCWSHYARESKWVDAEWRYALEQKGADCIEPVPIESPDICPPPAELNFKHFNDNLLYIINSVR